jgi:cytochrome c oxidase subunit 2
MQDIAWYVSLVVMALIAGVFLWVAAQARSSGDAERIAGAAQRWRRPFFWVLLIAGAAVMIGTLVEWPLTAYASRASKPDRVIKAIAHQWRWELSEQTVRSGELVEFQVTGGDVNHGFGIYQGRTKLIAQTQAMPGYTNRLQVRFDQPGKYEILCLEYCGVAHHVMAATITVQ